MFSTPKISLHEQSGVTLVELLVVIIIIVVIAAIALMQKGSADRNLKRQNVAQELKVAFERARFDSVKRRAQASPDVRATVSVTTNSYTLTTYPIDSGGTPTLNTQATSTTGQNVVIGGANSTTLPFTIYYNQRGEAVDVSGNSVSASFYVCQISCSSPSNSTANLIIVTPTGTVNLLPGGASAPVFNAPPVTSVPSANSINNTARLP